MSLFRLAMRMARTPPGRALTRFLFAKMTFALPAARLREPPTLLAFKHPNPAYAFHVLIVPKKAVPSIAELDASDSAFLTGLFSTVQSLVQEYQLPAYRLIVNGGEYQDFPRLHFHLVSPSPQPLSRGERGEG